jgi:hypothetical protein
MLANKTKLFQIKTYGVIILEAEAMPNSSRKNRCLHLCLSFWCWAASLTMKTHYGPSQSCISFVTGGSVLVMELTHTRSSPQTQTPVIGWLQKEA